MHHNAALLAALAASFIALGAATERSAFADPSCTTTSVNVDEPGRKVTVQFHNFCETHVGCHVEWSVRCGKGETEQKEESIDIASGAETAVVASANFCPSEAPWRINPPRWRCDEPRAEKIVDRSSGKKRKH